MRPGEHGFDRSSIECSRAGWDQAELAERALSNRRKRFTVSEIERGDRPVKIEEAFAFAWALGVAPLHLLVPSEDETPVVKDQDGDPIPPLYGGDDLEVAPAIVMQPAEARAWIAGISIRQVGDTEAEMWQAWHRFTVDRVPPSWKEERSSQIPELHEAYRSGEPVPLWYRVHAAAGGADEFIQDEEEK
jgi:hypothetical protein